MKTKTFITVLFLMCSITFYSQEIKNEKIKSLKIAHITKTLDLTTSEAEKFWPIYNTFENKQIVLRTSKMKKMRRDLKIESLENISDAEANTLLTQMDDLEDESLLKQYRKRN
jgi:Spy/CpxP family protein refolding chaperone